MSIYWPWVILLHLSSVLSGGYQRSDFDRFYLPVARRPVDVVADVINDLGVRILQQYDRHGNVAFSPTGAGFVLTALYEGSAGEGSEQIAQVLGLPRDRTLTRIGFRDIHRRLRSYLNADGFLGGLTLSNENTKLRPEYEDVLRFYGFDLGAMQPEINDTSAIPGDTTTESTGDNESSKDTTTLSEVPDTTVTGKPTNGEMTMSGTTVTTILVDSTTKPGPPETMLTTTENPVTSTVSAVEVLDVTMETGTLPDRLLEPTTKKMIDSSSTLSSSTMGVDSPTTLSSTSTSPTTAGRVNDSSVLPTTNSPFTVQSPTANPSTTPVIAAVITDTSTVPTVADLSTSTTGASIADSSTTPGKTVTTTPEDSSATPTGPSTMTYSSTTVGRDSSTTSQLRDSTTVPATTVAVTDSITQLSLTTLLSEIANRFTLDDSDQVSNESATPTGPSTMMYSSTTVGTDSSTTSRLRDSTTMPTTTVPVTDSITQLSLTTLLSEIANRFTLDDSDQVSNESATPTGPSTMMYSSTTAGTDSSTTSQLRDSTTMPTTTVPVKDFTTRLPLTTLLSEITNRFTLDDSGEISNESSTVTESLETVNANEETESSAEIGMQTIGSTVAVAREITTDTTAVTDSEITEDGTMSSKMILTTVDSGSASARTTRTTTEMLSSSLTDESLVTRDPVDPLMSASTEKMSDDLTVGPPADPSTVSADPSVNETSSLTNGDEGNDTTGPTDRTWTQETTDNTQKDSTTATPAAVSTKSTNGNRRRSSRSPRGYFYSVPDGGAWMQDVGSWKIYPASTNEATVRDSTQISFLVKGCDISLVSATTYVAVLPFAFFPSLRAVAIEFPLDDPRYNILLLMPTERTDTHRLARDLGGKSLRLLRKHLQPTWVRATIPSFMLRGFVTLTSFLQRLGITNVFEPRLADLSPMTSDEGVYARDVQQSIGVNIRNYMTVDRTHSRNGLFERAGPVPFTAQHPFLYFIIDAETSATLIAGRVDDPLNSRIL